MNRYTLPYDIGQRVRLGRGRKAVEVTVTAIAIYGPGAFQFECSWVHEGRRVSAWLTPHELWPRSRTTKAHVVT